MLDDEHDRWAKDKMRATLDELPTWPVVGPSDYPLISIALFTVRRTKEAIKANIHAFNQRDFEVVLVRPRGLHPSQTAYHQLPSSPMLKGETSHQAAVRVAEGTIGLSAANVLKIKSTATPLRVDGAPVVTMLYFVSSARPYDDLQSVSGSEASFFNLQTLTNGFAPVQFLLDHRELLRTAAGWLQSKFLTEQLPALFASQVMVDARRPGGDPSVVSKRVLLSTVENPMFQSGFNNMLEQSTVAYTSKYFVGGVLRPTGADAAGAVRRASKAIRMPRDSQAFVDGMPELDVLAEATTDDNWNVADTEYHRAHPSVRRAVSSSYSISGVDSIPLGQRERSFKAFEMMDINGDGEVTRAELEKAAHMPEIQFALKKIGSNIDQLLGMLDVDGSGSISVMEFLRGIQLINSRENLPPSLQAKMAAAAATGTKKRGGLGYNDGAGPARPESTLTADYDPSSNPVSPASTQFGFSDAEITPPRTPGQKTTWLGKDAQTPGGFPLTPPAPPQPVLAVPPVAALSPEPTVLSGPHAGTVRLSTAVRGKIARQAEADGEPEARVGEAAMGYKAKKKKELNVAKGDFIILQEKTDEPYKSDSIWLCGTIGLKTGYFRAGILKKAKVPGNNAPTSPLLTRDVGFADAESVEAIMPYRAAKARELNVEKGDIIILQDKEHEPYMNDAAWLRGAVGMKNGYFKAGVVKMKTLKVRGKSPKGSSVDARAGGAGGGAALTNALAGFQTKKPAALSLPNTADLIAGPDNNNGPAGAAPVASPTLTDWGSPGGNRGFSPPSFPATTKMDPFSPAGFSPSGISTGSFSPGGFESGDGDFDASGGNGWAAGAAEETLDDFAPPANEMFADDLNADFSNPLFG